MAAGSEASPRGKIDVRDLSRREMRFRIVDEATSPVRKLEPAGLIKPG